MPVDRERADGHVAACRDHRRAFTRDACPVEGDECPVRRHRRGARRPSGTRQASRGCGEVSIGHTSDVTCLLSDTAGSPSDFHRVKVRRHGFVVRRHGTSFRPHRRTFSAPHTAPLGPGWCCALRRACRSAPSDRRSAPPDRRSAPTDRRSAPTDPRRDVPDRRVRVLHTHCMSAPTPRAAPSPTRSDPTDLRPAGTPPPARAPRPVMR